jgi:drug/metabolite transporter, DME family
VTPRGRTDGLAARLGLLQVCAAGVLWGTGGLVVAVLHDRTGLGAMTASAWRMILAAGAVLLFAVATGRRRSVVATFRAHPVPTIAVGVGTAVYQGLYFGSVLMVGVSVSTVVSLGLAPILAAAWEHATRRTRPALREVGVLAAALVGLILVSLNAGHVSSTPGSRPGLGLTLAVIAGATYAATTVLGHNLATRVDAVALNTCATTTGAVALAPFLALAAATGGPVLPTDWVSVGLLLYLGIATMALAYGLLYVGLRTTKGSAATIATLLEPVSAALLAALLLGERLTWATLVGGVLILAGVAALRPADEPGHGDERTHPDR